MFFLTNHLFATLLAREQETSPPAMQKDSFMVNKTSTIKRICSLGCRAIKTLFDAVPEAVTPLWSPKV
jgi:hypothetical protein